ncbi:MAG: hypothetical protein WA746_19260 [Isosphaeraceae bacterium]
MRLLLDTHTLLWFALTDPQLSGTATSLIMDPDNEKLVSPASYWEIAIDGRVLDLGSFRASGGFLAEILNRQTGAEHYDYLDFYMGTIWVAQRADLTPVCQVSFHGG